MASTPSLTPILALCATPAPQTRYRAILGPANGIPATHHEPRISLPTMFDRYTFQSDSYPKRTTITEKRAPTDESVRLLREMEAAAEKQVVERGRTNNNDLQFRWVIRNLYAEDLLQLTVFVTLNGNEHKMTTNWCPTRFGNPREKLRLIYGEVEKLIAEKITAGLIEKHLRDLVPQP